MCIGFRNNQMYGVGNVLKVGPFLTDRFNRKDKRVADSLVEKGYAMSPWTFFSACSITFRKDTPVGRAFGSGFLWPEAIDATADIYMGVS